MSDQYQAVYDAIRSRFHVDADSAIRDAINLQFGTADMVIRGAAQDFSIAAAEMQRPSVLYRPAVGRDGNKWCALYGPNLMEGVCGFGDSPAEAMTDFDVEWNKKIVDRGAA